MNHNRIFFLLAITTVVSLVSCGRQTNDGKAIFRYNESAGVSTLDPAFAKDQAIIWTTSQLYNGLVRLDTALKIQPCLAKRWTISDDGKIYTFTLRDDIYFHKNPLFNNNDSTRKVVADDFVYSLNRIIDPKVASPGLWIFSHLAADGFSAPNDSTFVLKLKEPFAPMLSLLSMPYCSVVPREVVEHYGTDFRSHPCGTGPFRFQYWKEGVKLVLRRNDNYFERDSNGRSLPYLDAVAVTFIIDKQTAFLEFIKGNLDFMNSLDASYKDEILTRTGQLKKKYADRIDMISIPFLNTEYLGFNMEETGKASKLIRQAINYGFDRRKMMKYLRNNVGEPGCKGMIPCGLAPYDSLSRYGYDYNPEKARELLVAAGYPGGKGLQAITLSTTSSYLDICKYIQQQLDLIGITIKIDVNPPAALREQIAQGKSSWFRGSWIADYPDAENYMTLFYSPNHAPAGPNYTRYSSPKVDRLYEKALKETDESKRALLYRQMDSIVMEEAPVVVLYYDQILHFTHKNVSGIRTNAMNALDLRYARITYSKNGK
ncbi:MAG: ABC transporter substrate-binding protein [Bacteroidales bacterium]|nr:ABC transporter substrate-binding protein [Bacteroidales bacterium]